MAFCIVTGSSSGNGFAIAKSLRDRNHQVCGIDIELPTSNNCSKFIKGDVSDMKIIEESFEIFQKSKQEELFLINNAGITNSSFPHHEKDWDKTLEINLKAPFLWSNFYLKRVINKKIKKGGIIFIGSLATFMGFPKNPSYQASKCGIIGLTNSFAYDLGEYGIRVNCVSPGYIKTNMTKLSYENETLNKIRQKHMILKRWGEPQDIANLVCFLCSEDSSYITGANIPVDGGWHIRGMVEN